MYISNVEIYMNIIYSDNIKQLNVHWSLLCQFTPFGVYNIFL
jgi:hypothetical protein